MEGCRPDEENIPCHCQLGRGADLTLVPTETTAKEADVAAEVAAEEARCATGLTTFSLAAPAMYLAA